MSDFGIAGEGVTDNITLENIILGVYHHVEDLDEDEISYLQPLQDATDEDGQGGWTRLLTYLENKRFRDDVVNNSHLVIQIDTDVAEEPGFDVQLTDDKNRILPVEDIVKNVKARLIRQIESGKEGFYDEHDKRIIFAISVHSLECWLFSLYNKLPKENGRVIQCEANLARLLQKDKKTDKFVSKGMMKKNHTVYDTLSSPFYKKRGAKIADVCKVDISFRLFIEDLRNIDYPE